MSSMIQTGKAVATAAIDVLAMGYEDAGKPEEANRNPADPFQKAAVEIGSAYAGVNVPKPV